MLGFSTFKNNQYHDFRIYLRSFKIFLCPAATVKDSLTRHDGFSFGTWDRHPAVPNCAELGGGWWYENSTCAVSSNLNGIYPQHGTRRNIYWAFLSQRADGATPTTSEIKIRPADFF